MPKVDGRKIVVVATAGTLAAVAFGQIYLPFIADRDKIRGLSEEDEVPEGARKEMEALFQQRGGTFPPPQQQKHPGSTPGSMWNNMRRDK
eukprot:CAMPEP_0202480094 /NCGR_PEP_ID=MMETSP1361-20130828/220_1 /ASSEMBLY_ACC=CAM_ASM_000849 /TAXON_ID=210615 /ORGANISM="Staurosira complex sp., Strain CCMP2646" /LENGTH=89 /DNA_ID=CAMNT_0049107495 /DNA_START=113 /DNA_END=382 /DNA_ORIENTATION=-